MEKKAKGKPKKSPEPPAKPKRKRIAPSLKGSPRPKVSLFLDRAVLDKAKARAERNKMPLTCLLEQFVKDRLSKK